MMALQKSLMEQSDIVPLLSGMEFEKAPNEKRWGTKDGELVVSNPPVLIFDDPEALPFTIVDGDGKEVQHLQPGAPPGTLVKRPK